jgi:hypothetical protein
VILLTKNYKNLKLMKTKLLVFVFLFTLLSCSKDDSSTQDSTDSGLKISGKVMAPNSNFPISKAKVTVTKNGAVIAEKTTDAIGNFEIDKLPAGNLEVLLSKGDFKRTIAVNLQSNYQLTEAERSLNVFPKIAVVRGSWDEIEQVLVNIGLVNPLTNEPAFDIVPGKMTDYRLSSQAQETHNHGGAVAHRNVNSLPANVTFTFNDLLHDTTLLNSYDVIFLNCGARETYVTDPVAMNNLKTYVQNGGILYATDWMYKYIKVMFEESQYLTFSTPEKAGSSLVANATILNPDLAAWLTNQGINVNPTVQINGFLGGWQMVDTHNATNVTSWLSAQSVTYSSTVYTNKSLAFTFQYGSGGVFYSSFHTHGDDPSEATIAQMMNYFIFELSSM